MTEAGNPPVLHKGARKVNGYRTGLTSTWRISCNVLIVPADISCFTCTDCVFFFLHAGNEILFLFSLPWTRATLLFLHKVLRALIPQHSAEHYRQSGDAQLSLQLWHSAANTDQQAHCNPGCRDIFAENETFPFWMLEVILYMTTI